ncbi:MAG: hypothetical protein IPM74_05165 [Crocinitomicaceae bacterium]|nr:hypothetical protein [Crocinitomicaceae bacterium]MBK8925293.1 hypothetical protein [Crocinitomicaceae bacterium]
MILQTIVLSIFFCSGNLLSSSDPFIEKSKSIIAEKDLDGDGVLCQMECADELLKNFKLIDTNDDLFLNEDEIAIYLKNREAKK